jgi:hypothetical protein
MTRRRRKDLNKVEYALTLGPRWMPVPSIGIGKQLAEGRPTLQKQ